ncbi:MAG: excalibur calcium-binding domain-containing protein [Synechococcales cyanobacterium CRU_2_2]|nr:excalibur calcium-binding domain-containing protein [Synechococcales cyanobacterium CRU_2_2]
MTQTQYRSKPSTDSIPKKWYQQKRWIFSSLGLMPPLGIVLLWRTSWSRSSKITGTILSTLILMMAIAAPEPNNSSVAEQPVTTPATEAPELKATKASIAPTAAPPAAYEEAIALATTATQNRATATTSDDWAEIADTWQTSINQLNEVADGDSFAADARSKQKEYQLNHEDAVVQMNAARVAENEAIAEQQRQEQEAQFAEIQREAAAALQVVPSSEASDGYVSGSCESLRDMGVGSDFTPGDPNYTLSRDRDTDGVACES